MLAQEGRFQETELLLLSAWHGMENTSAAQLPRKRVVLEKIDGIYAAWNRRVPNAGKAKRPAD